nr:verprolin-like [Aegilops tauschii subsp. strangulata]
MSSSASFYSNPFAGPDPADIRDINIHDRVPVVLDAIDATYFAWKTYFSLLFRKNNLVDHVDGSVDSRAMVGDSEWTAIDATLIRWFFTTISKDLFHTVVSDVDDYCRRLKTLADELRDIGAKVDDDLLLSTLTAGLNKDFGNAVSNLSLIPEPSFPKFVAYLRLEERRMKGVKKRMQHHALAAGTSRGAPPPSAPPAPPVPPGFYPLPPAPPAPPAAPSSRSRVAGATATAAGEVANRRKGGGRARQQQQQATPPWTYGTNPWTGVVHAYSMPVPRAPAPGILGPRPASHQALFIAQNAAPYSGYGVAPVPTPAYGAAPAPAYGGFLPPQVPPPWDPALLAALHSASSPSSYGGGGDWYMGLGATAHMTAHPVTNLVSVRRLARENPITVEFDNIGFSVKDARTRMFGRPILALQTDNGKEFDNVAVRNLLASHGTIFRLTCPYTSEQNGRAERVVRTLNDCFQQVPSPSASPTALFAPASSSGEPPSRALGSALPALPAPAAPVAAAPSVAPVVTAASLTGVVTRARTGTLRPNTAICLTSTRVLRLPRHRLRSPPPLAQPFGIRTG